MGASLRKDGSAFKPNVLYRTSCTSCSIILIMATVRVEQDPPWRKNVVIELWRDGFPTARVLAKTLFAYMQNVG